MRAILPRLERSMKRLSEQSQGSKLDRNEYSSKRGIKQFGDVSPDPLDTVRQESGLIYLICAMSDSAYCTQDLHITQTQAGILLKQMCCNNTASQNTMEAKKNKYAFISKVLKPRFCFR